MNGKQMLKVIGIALSCSPVTFYSCYAARIYNELSYTVDVTANGFEKPYITIEAGQKSDSLSWNGLCSCGL